MKAPVRRRCCCGTAASKAGSAPSTGTRSRCDAALSRFAALPTRARPSATAPPPRLPLHRSSSPLTQIAEALQSVVHSGPHPDFIQAFFSCILSSQSRRLLPPSLSTTSPSPPYHKLLAGPHRRSPLLVSGTGIKFQCRHIIFRQVLTGSVRGAGTDANVHCQLFGKRGDTGKCDSRARGPPTSRSPPDHTRYPSSP